MIPTLLSLLVFVVIVALVFYVLRSVPLPPPWKVISQGIVALIAFLVLIDLLFGLGVTGLPPLRTH